MMRTFEAFLALVILFGAVFALSISTTIKTQAYGALKGSAQDTVLAFAHDANFRNLALDAESHADANLLRAYISPHIFGQFALQVCDLNAPATCYGESPNTKTYAVTTYLLDGNFTHFKLRKVRLYVWQFGGEETR